MGRLVSSSLLVNIIPQPDIFGGCHGMVYITAGTSQIFSFNRLNVGLCRLRVSKLIKFAFSKFLLYAPGLPSSSHEHTAESFFLHPSPHALQYVSTPWPVLMSHWLHRGLLALFIMASR